MRIGILTLPFHSNYGGILQAYALQTVLHKMGHEVIFVKYPQKNDLKSCVKNILSPVINILGRYTHRYTTRKILKEQNVKISAFREKYMAREVIVEELLTMTPKVDAIIVGSDQVWRHYGHLDIRFFYLDFICDFDVKRIAYAASFGIKDWEFDDDLTTSLSRLAKKFSAVSVREQDGITLCNEHLGINAIQVLDPTLLLHSADYKKLTASTYVDIHPLTTYVIGPSIFKHDIIIAVEKELNLSAQPLSSMEDNPRCVDIKSKSSIEKWLIRLMGADLLVTDSFHGTAFAINFNVPFIVLQNSEAGNSRLFNILEKFHLENRMVTSCEQAIRVIKDPINWSAINEIRRTEENKSVTFLHDVLNNG